MQEAQNRAQHPNKLRILLAVAGLNQRETARESGIPEGTLRHYVAGEQVIPRRDRIKLAKVIGCETQDLAPQYDMQEQKPKKAEASCIMHANEAKGSSSFETLDECFSFGRIKTTSIVLDGDGTEAYLPANIRTHYDPQPAVFFDEVMQTKKHIQQEQEDKLKNGESYQWNGEKYHLAKIAISREPVNESMTLGLWFKPRDHYTGLATRRCLDTPVFRQKYLSGDWSIPHVGLSCSMGVDLTVLSTDGYAMVTQRGHNQSVYQNTFHSSVSEAVSPSFDRGLTGTTGTTDQAPDLYHCARRGLTEELGLQESVDFSVADILFLSFSVDTHYALYGLRGMVKVKKSAQEMLRNWHAGVKDKMENAKIFAVPFTSEEICSFVFSHEPWAGGGLVSLYHTLVHEFGRERVNTVVFSS